MTPEEEQYLSYLESQVKVNQSQSGQLSTNMATMFSGEENINLVRWQLDISEELGRIEHLLRRHVPKRDSLGNEYFIEGKIENQLFNEEGIQEILNVLAWYLNKNLLLSNFDDEEIKLRCMQFANFLTDFIFMNYEKFGLDNPEKIKHYPLLVLNIVNSVEASYHRALFGNENKSLRTARAVYQTENSNMMPNNQQMNNQNKFSLFKPNTWKK